MADINEKIDQVGEKLNELNQTADNTSEYDQSDINNNKLIAALAFIFAPLFWIVSLFTKISESKFVRFHLNQGLVLWIVSIIFNILSNILYFFFIFRIVFWVVSVAILVLVIIGILNIYNGRAKELPVIGNIKLLK